MRDRHHGKLGHLSRGEPGAGGEGLGGEGREGGGAKERLIAVLEAALAAAKELSDEPMERAPAPAVTEAGMRPPDVAVIWRTNSLAT